MNADYSRRTFLLGGLATGAVLLAGKTFLHPSAARAATEAVSLDACINMTPKEMADRSQYVMAAWKYLQDAAAEIGNPGLRAAVLDIMKNPAPLLAEGDAKAIMKEFKGCSPRTPRPFSRPAPARRKARSLFIPRPAAAGTATTATPAGW